MCRGVSWFGAVGQNVVFLLCGSVAYSITLDYVPKERFLGFASDGAATLVEDRIVRCLQQTKLV